MQDTLSIRLSLGNDAAISADGRRALDRREISIRWLSGTFLVGLTSCAMMGYALLAAFEGRQQLGVPAEASVVSGEKVPHEISKRGERVIESRMAARAVDRAIIKVPVVMREGGMDVVRPESFSLVRMTLASDYQNQGRYPDFDPLRIFADAGTAEGSNARMSAIYSSDIASNISLRVLPFPDSGLEFEDTDEISTDEIEQDMRFNGALLASMSSEADSTYRVDPLRFADPVELSPEFTGSLIARVIEENVSTAVVGGEDSITPEFVEDVIPSRARQRISTILQANGYDALASANVEEALKARSGIVELNQDQALRIGILQTGEMSRIVRISVYTQSQHLLTLAVDDLQRLVSGVEPWMSDWVLAALNEQAPVVAPAREAPTIYDGIYRAALSYGMTSQMITQVMRQVAANVDLNATTKATDKLEAFFSASDEDGRATPASELLYFRARFGEVTRSYYRFQDRETKSVDYYDGDGKGLRPLLLRRPVPNARLTSNFGGRIHPVLGYAQGHTGIDLAAPQGTPIMAAGDGTVEKAGWASTYGNHTIIRHSNGYVTSYSHQSAIAKGIREGAKVRQGQIIGYVGSTGRSTGAHLHYELAVNGTRIDAMRTKLPPAGDLTGEAYEQFISDRERIDGLINGDQQPSPAATPKPRWEMRPSIL